MKPLAGVAVIVATLALTACTNDCPQPEALGAVPVAMSVPMPAPVPPAPRPAPRPAPAYKAPAPAYRAPAPPKAPAPPRVPRPKPPRSYVPPSIARPVQRPRVYDYRQVYIQHRTDHTPLLYLMVMNGMFDSPQPVPERCEP